MSEGWSHRQTAEKAPSSPRLAASIVSSNVRAPVHVRITSQIGTPPTELHPSHPTQVPGDPGRAPRYSPHMAPFSREEVEREFHQWWEIGNVGEDWDAWVEMFVPDVTYTEHFWGALRGQQQVWIFINAVMKGVPEIYTVLDWYTVDGGTVVFHCQNRRDNPDASGPPYWDFAGLSVIEYAGDGRWSSEEDFWDVNGARRTSAEYAAACARAGATEPLQRLTRHHWPAGPPWARTDRPPHPSWLDHDEVPAITRPRELAALLGGTG